MSKAKAGIMAAVAAGMMLGGILTAAPANADGTYAPSCVSRDTTKPTIVIKNNCGKTMNLNVHFGALPDSGCKTYTAGQQRTFLLGEVGWYQHVVLC